MHNSPFCALSARKRGAPESGISEFLACWHQTEGLIPLRVEEGGLPIPEFSCKAGNEAMRGGDTFCTFQRGVPELRHSLARYHAKQFGKGFHSVDFIVVGSGMQAVQLALQAVAGSRGEFLCLFPAGPNFAATAATASGR